MMQPIVRVMVTGVVLLISVQSAVAQVVPDGTLSTRVSSPNNLNFTIDGGARSGNNLFHSFSQFSIPTTGSAAFNNPLDVQHIFARVTGGAVSNIDGLLSANGTANLFLLNPNGILFGPNAQLNLGGSFLATTASRIQFADGIELNTTNSTPLLTMSVPIGLQMGQTPGTITVQGKGHQLTSSDSLGLTPLVQTTRPGLQVKPGNSLVLVGNNISLNNGVLGAAQGQLEVGSVTDGWVSLNTNNAQWQLGYARGNEFGDVSLTGRSLLDVSGVNAGAIQVQGRQINLRDGSVILSQTRGLQPGGAIHINATEGLLISGTTTDSRIRSGISSETLGPGVGSQIVVAAPIVEVQQGGNIFTKTFNRGVAGDIQITAAQLLQLQGYSALNPTQISTIGSGALGLAGSGTVKVTAGDLQLLDGAVLATTTFGAGASGPIVVNADRITVSGISPIGAPSSLATTSFGSGNSGAVNLYTRRLAITDAGAVAATAYGKGNAGSILVKATESVALNGFVQMPGERLTSNINSSVLVPNPVFQRLLKLVDRPTGAAGIVEINSPSLVLTNGSITVRNVGAGQGGTILVTADQIRLSQNSRLSAETASGLGGDLDLRTNLLALRRDSGLIATAGSRGNGGNIKITAPIILGLEDSDIVANAFLGQGGNIQITTQGLIGLQNRPQLSAASDITASSEFGVNGTVQVNTIGVNPNSGIVPLPTELIDPKQLVADGCRRYRDSRFIVTGRGGLPDQAIKTVLIDHAWLDLRAMVKPSPQPRTDIMVEATALQMNSQGQPELIGGAIASPQMLATCAR
jgi:filamentous hemagglutinin family protein